MAGINSITPSGIRTTPKLFPCSARRATILAISVTTSSSDWFLASISSEIRQTLGCTCKAHSSAICEAERPMSLIKCQYLRDELQSRCILPITSEYTLQAVSKPKEHSIISFLRSPSMVLGQPITCTPALMDL